MELKFNKIELHNFCSFANSSLELSDMGNILVTGRNYCKLDNAFSNGSGKSSIFNGICYALTGETSQGVSNGVENIFTNPDDCWVELTFTADNDEFVVRRIKTPRPDLKIYINGEDKSGKGIRESAKLLATYLPDLTSELLCSIIILGQGLPQRFSNNKPAGRKEILEKLTKSDFMIQSIKDKLELRLNNLKTNLREKEDELIANNTQLDIYKKQLVKLENSLTEYESSEISIEDQIAEVEKQIVDLDNTYANSKVKIDRLSSESSKLDLERSDLMLNNTNELNKKLESVDNSLTEKNKQLIDLTAEIKVLDKELKKLNSITDICPTCGQKIPEINKPDTTEQTNNLIALKNTQISLKDSINVLEYNKAEIIKTHNEEHSGQLTDLSNKINNIAKEIKELNEISTNAFNSKSKLTINLFELKNLKENYGKLANEIADVSKTINSLETIINKLTNDTNTITSHINIVQQMITLAKREFRGVLLSNIIQFINKKVKQYAVEVFGNDRLDFILNENCIDIIYCNKLYENLSGGEKQKIDIIIQLALRDILSKQLNIHSNLLILDEIYDNMDTISCQKITNLISTLTDIDSIFIISHHAQDLEITYDNNLQVSKNENGVSSLAFI